MALLVQEKKSSIAGVRFEADDLNEAKKDHAFLAIEADLIQSSGLSMNHTLLYN